MAFSCKKCFKIYKKEINKCTQCGGEIKQIINDEYIKEKKINHRCPHCNHNFNFDFDICPNCGKRSNRCTNCGFNILIKLKICPGCGKKIK
jgi:rRNA maturation endonuclease Nob1